MILWLICVKVLLACENMSHKAGASRVCVIKWKRISRTLLKVLACSVSPYGTRLSKLQDSRRVFNNGLLVQLGIFVPDNIPHLAYIKHLHEKYHCCLQGEIQQEKNALNKIFRRRVRCDILDGDPGHIVVSRMNNHRRSLSCNSRSNNRS